MHNDRDNDQEVHVHIHFDKPININLHGGEQGSGNSNAIITLLNQMRQEMTAQFEALKAEVARNTTVDQSIVTLVQGLAAQIETMKDDPVALQKLVDDLRASNDTVNAAVVANTPVPPAPTERTARR